MEQISKEDIEYIKYVYDNKQRAIKPDTKRIIRLYNQVMPDGKHIFHPVSEQICSCNLRPYLINLYRKLENEGYFNYNNEEKQMEVPANENVKDMKEKVESTAKPHKKKGR